VVCDFTVEVDRNPDTFAQNRSLDRRQECRCAADR
jgi:hypothetical protein